MAPQQPCKPDEQSQWHLLHVQLSGLSPAPEGPLLLGSGGHPVSVGSTLALVCHGWPQDRGCRHVPRERGAHGLRPTLAMPEPPQTPTAGGAG